MRCNRRLPLFLQGRQLALNVLKYVEGNVDGAVGRGILYFDKLLSESINLLLAKIEGKFALAGYDRVMNAPIET